MWYVVSINLQYLVVLNTINMFLLYAVRACNTNYRFVLVVVVDLQLYPAVLSINLSGVEDKIRLGKNSQPT